MNLQELQGYRKAEKEYQTGISKTIDELKRKTMTDLSTEIEIIKANASFKISEIIEQCSAELTNKIIGIKELKGDKGEKGDRGLQGEQGLQGIPGKAGLSGKEGRIGPQGIPGPQGERGEDGSEGIIEIDQLFALILMAVEDPAFKIDASKILNLPKATRGKKHGGGDTVLAGSGVSITINTDGSKTISAIAAGFQALQELSTTTPDGNQQTFQFTHNVGLIQVSGQLQILGVNYTIPTAKSVTFIDIKPVGGLHPDNVVNIYA